MLRVIAVIFLLSSSHLAHAEVEYVTAGFGCKKTDSFAFSWG